MTSTPVVQSRSSFTVLSSNVMDPQEGPSGTNQDDTTIREYEAEMLKTTQSSRVLLSIDDDDDDNHVQSKEEKKNVDYQFSLGSKPSGGPQRFFTSRTKPSFKVSSFVSTSPLIPSGSSSSFYPGRTSFGGASALQNRSIKRQRVSPVASGLPTKKGNIKPRSVRSGRMGAVTSDTARKILGALEKMSSPVKDASKLPNSPSSILFNPPKKRTDSSLGFLSSTAKRPGQGPPTSLLTTPRTINIQHIDKTSTPFSFTNRFETGNIRPSAPVTTFKSRGLPTSFSPEEDSRAGGKMKRQRQTSHFAAASVTDKEEDPVNTLPEIRNPAPLLVQSLPKFSFGGPSASTSQATTTTTKLSVETKVPVTSSKPSLGSFTFSQPEKISSDKGQAGTSVVKSSFQFSKPMSKEKDVTETVKVENKDSATMPFEIIASSVVSPISKAEAPSQNLLLVKQPKGWECDTCMVINSTDKTSCIACTAPKPVKQDAKAVKVLKQGTLADKFKPSVGSWECPTCMIMNSKDKDTCVACQTSNPSKKEVKAESTSEPTSLKNLFKPAQGSWECDLCMVQNTADKSECIACNSMKPGSGVPAKEPAQSSVGAPLRMKFGAPADSWECTECMVPNGGDKTECISCGSKKPGSALKNTPSFSADALRNKFAPPEKSWECDACMVLNKADATECIACSTPKPGGSVVPKTSAPSFSFGTSGSSSGAIFGTGSASSSTVKFGNTAGSSGFTFGSSGSGGIKFGNSGSSPGTFGTTESKGFSFGNSKDSGKVIFGGATGFSINASKDAKVSETKVDEGGAKTEENNNKLAPNAAVVAGTSMFSTPTASEGSKASAEPVKGGGISSIAEAAQAGLLKVPGLEQKTSPVKDVLSDLESKQETPKFSFGAVANGPITNELIGGNSVVFSSKNETQDSSGTKQFDLADNESTGNSNFFAAKPSSESNLSNKASETSITTNSGFIFGASSAFSAEPTNSAGNQPTQPILSNHSSGFSFSGTSKQTDNADPPKSDTVLKFNFGQSSTQSAIPSLFGSSKSDKENNMGAQKPFQFNSEPVISSTFGTSQSNSFTNPAGSAENKLLFNRSIPATQSPFSFTNSNPEAKSIVFGGDNKTSVLHSAGSNSVFGSSTTSNSLSGGGFSFGSSLTSSSSGSVFGSQANQNAEQNPSLGGFGFAGAPTPSTKLFTDAVSNTPQEKATPFSFTAPTSNPASGGFKFGNADVNSSPFGSGTEAPANAAGSGGFNFTNNQPAASGGFNFTSGTNAGGATLFSSGAAPAAPTGRVIRKAVRRKQR